MRCASFPVSLKCAVARAAVYFSPPSRAMSLFCLVCFVSSFFAASMKLTCSRLRQSGRLRSCSGTPAPFKRRFDMRRGGVIAFLLITYNAPSSVFSASRAAKYMRRHGPKRKQPSCGKGRASPAGGMTDFSAEKAPAGLAGAKSLMRFPFFCRWRAGG